MVKIPKAKKISDKKIIDMLREELLRKDKVIEELREEKDLLMKLVIKQQKKELENKDIMTDQKK